MTQSETFYRNELLPLAGLSADEDGLISLDTIEAILDDKRLRLPTDEFLADPDWEKFIAFHPLSEIITRGESEVLAYYRKVAEITLNGRITRCVGELIRICADLNLQKGLKSAQVPLTQVFPDADAKSQEAFCKILDAFMASNLNRHIKINLKRGVDNDQAKRKAVINFPLAEQLLENEKSREVFGVKLRKVDFNGFRAIMEYIFEDTLDAISEKYSVVGNPPIAPFLVILLKAIGKVQKRLNHLGKLFLSVTPGMEEVITSAKCIDYRATIEACSGEIPTLNYNEGTVITTAASAEMSKLSNIQKNTGPVRRGAALDTNALRQELEAETRQEEQPEPVKTERSKSSSYLDNLNRRPSEMPDERQPLRRTEPPRGSGYLDNLNRGGRQSMRQDDYRPMNSYRRNDFGRQDTPPWDNSDPYR